jgi:hypothetical protein
MAHVVPDEVEPLEAMDRFPDDPARVLVFRQVRGDPVRDPAGRGDLADDPFHPRGRDVNHGDLGSLAGEAKGAGTPHAGARGGHDPDLSCQAHVPSSREEIRVGNRTAIPRRRDVGQSASVKKLRMTDFRDT